ncbi:glycosyltransferase [Geodermatophilus sabuli]|uniref:Glycosyltransferase n=1 Tax=Geodermatophilus sabuli TaxID=1564158 RepID=A0A7K3VYQ5_9ACTN|nr:glycosyltransferase [Geodermatophilus sabuli]
MRADDVDPSTVVAVLTYRRTAWLPALLDELEEQASALSPPAEVLVIDNDPAGSAADVVSSRAGHHVRYVHEPVPGISAARNRALGEAGRADLLVFLDDDELPSPGWLTHLVGTWQVSGAAAVAGPVPARLLGPADPWVAASGTFDRARHPTGTAMPEAASGNLLLDLAQVRALGLRFHEGFGLTGGEDTLFTRELVARGGEIRWCDEAEAVESIPVERLTRDWVIARNYRCGSSWSRVELHLTRGAVRRARLRAVLTARAVANTAIASVQLLGALVRGDLAGRARSVCTLVSYAGLLVGAFGVAHEEYARTPTRLDATPAPTTGASTGPGRVAAG